MSSLKLIRDNISSIDSDDETSSQLNGSWPTLLVIKATNDQVLTKLSLFPMSKALHGLAKEPMLVMKMRYWRISDHRM